MRPQKKKKHTCVDIDASQMRPQIKISWWKLEAIYNKMNEHTSMTSSARDLGEENANADTSSSEKLAPRHVCRDEELF